MLCYHYFVFAFVKATLADTPCPHKFSGHGVSAGDSFGICEFCAVCSKSAPMQSFVIQSDTALWDCCRIAFLSLFVQNNPYFCVAKTTILPFGNSPFLRRLLQSAPNVEFRNSKGMEMCQQAHGPYSRNAIAARGDTFELTRRYLLSFCPRPLWLAHLPQCSYFIPQQRGSLEVHDLHRCAHLLPFFSNHLLKRFMLEDAPVQFNKP